MSCLMVADLICPKCGGPVVWCNGGDVIYDFSSQFKATCPSCGYEDWAASFQKVEKQTVRKLKYNLYICSLIRIFAPR